jgi:hypothetical protein
VKLTLEVEAEALEGFSEADVGVVRDNARQLKLNAGSTGFGWVLRAFSPETEAYRTLTRQGIS